MNTPSTVFAVALAACALSVDADTRPDSHAPISVMGEHTHKKSEVMLSYRYMHMSMQGNRDGSSSISPEEIVSRVPNRLATMPPTLRVVPTKMTMDMHMVGAMYAPSDSLTLMAMTSYTRKEMDHLTFMGPRGTNRLGTFTTKAEGFGDSSLAALIRLPSQNGLRWHATLGLSLPTGDTNKTDDILTPMNTRPSPRLPYPMQLGSGTYDLITGLTLSGDHGPWGWGAQWRSLFRLGDNSRGYTLGDEHRARSWISYLARPSISLSGRLGYYDRSNINGFDSAITAPVQTADPDRQGAQRIDLGVGVNFLFPGERHRLAAELTLPIAQDLAGPQLETDWSLTVGWQFAI